MSGVLAQIVVRRASGAHPTGLGGLRPSVVRGKQAGIDAHGAPLQRDHERCGLTGSEPGANFFSFPEFRAAFGHAVEL